MRQHAGTNKRLAVDKIENIGYVSLCSRGVEVLEGQVLTEHARSIKNENELKAMRCAIAACEAAVEEMRAIMRPGISENEMWAALHAGNIKRGGEWIETRILSSGPRTNPWPVVAAVAMALAPPVRRHTGPPRHFLPAGWWPERR